MASAAREARPVFGQEHAGRVVIEQQSIGVGVIVFRGDGILYGIRCGAHGAGSWSFPGV